MKLYKRNARKKTGLGKLKELLTIMINRFNGCSTKDWYILLSCSLSVFLRCFPWIHCYQNSTPSIILSALLLILSVAYIIHYYQLENSVQKWYLISIKSINGFNYKGVSAQLMDINRAVPDSLSSLLIPTPTTNIILLLHRRLRKSR